MWLGKPDPQFIMLLIIDEQSELYGITFEGSVTVDSWTLNAYLADLSYEEYWLRVT